MIESDKAQEYRTEPFTVEEVATIPEYKQHVFYRAVLRSLSRTLSTPGGRERLDELTAARHAREAIAAETRE